MAMPIDPSTPADQAMLLRLIDAKFETTNAKLEGIAATLTAMGERFGHYDKRFDDHEHRLGDIESQMAARELLITDYHGTKTKLDKVEDRTVDLETWRTEEKTTAANAGKWGSFIWGAFGSGITALLMFLATMYFQAQPKVAEQGIAVSEHSKVITGPVTLTAPR